MRTIQWIAAAALAVSAAAAQNTVANGTICRMNRGADRLILSTGDHQRLRVALTSDTAVTFERESYPVEDLRPGMHVKVVGTSTEDHIDADAIHLKYRWSDAVADAVFGPTKRTIGRFAVQEAKTEYFSLNAGGGNYVRVDAKSAYGPHGRVYVSKLRSGDLLELDGKWTKPNELHATYINVITDEEATGCRSEPRDKDAEQAFLEN